MTAPVGWVDWIAYADALGRFLFLNWAFQATCVLAAGLLLTRLPRLTAAVRHALLAASLLGAAVMPLTHLMPESVSRAAWSAAPRIRQAAPAAPPAVAVRRAPTASTTPAAPEFPIGGVLLLTWMAVAAVRLGALAYGMAQVSRWRCRGVPADRDRLYEAVGCAVADIPVLEAPDLRIPGVVGIRRPCILLPPGIVAKLDLPALRHVLLHEEAHVRRRDPLFLLLAAVCHAVLFWHPLAGVVRRAMEAAAEAAADAHVLGSGIAAPAYARTLVAMLRRSGSSRGAAALSPLGAGTDLRRRVVQVLAGVPQRSPLAAVAAATALLGASSAALTAELGRRPEPPRRAKPMPARPSKAMPERKAEPGKAPAPLPSRKRRSPKPVIRPRSRPIIVAAPGRESLAFQPTFGFEPVLSEAAALPPQGGRCVVFLLDVSEGARPYQAALQAELIARVERLGDQDRFNVIAFDGDVQHFAAAPAAASEENVAGARAWLAGLPEGVGMDAEAGIRAALAVPEVTSVLLLADGPAWRGPLAREALLTLFARDNRAGVPTAFGMAPRVPDPAAAFLEGHFPDGHVERRQEIRTRQPLGQDLVP
jgi:beta-lactamase regulating signal transducer with metallopeptidase domain